MAAVCCDTSFLISLYSNDVHSAQARFCAGGLAQPISVTEFNEFELMNAVRLLVFRRLKDAAAAALILSDFAKDLSSGKLVLAPCAFAAVFVEAKKISSLWTLTGGHRAPDILHVAAAIHLRAGEFLTFDLNQSRLATAEGLVVRP